LQRVQSVPGVLLAGISLERMHQEDAGANELITISSTIEEFLTDTLRLIAQRPSADA